MSTDADKNYEDVTKYGLTDEGEAELLENQVECTFIWSNKEGFPVGVIMNYIYRDGRFWVTLSSQRARVAAVRRDPRVSIAISSLGSDVKTRKSLTYKGHCIVHEDDETKQWFYRELAAAVRRDDPEAAAAFVTFLDSPRRVVFEIVPEQRIGFDSTKMWQDTPSAARKHE
ncbi:pyridoxamine 5'-phosphate oxidase family protein [Jatrophihabitans fulvus]